MIKQIIPLAFLLFISCGTNNKKVGESMSLSSAQELNLEDDARVVSALKFINAYTKIDVSSPENVGEWVESSDMVTESFKIEYKRLIEKGWEMDPEMGLDSDPIINGQDYSDDGYELDFIGDKDDYIFLKGKGEEQFKIAVKVIKDNSKWLVDGSGIVNMP